MSTNGTRICELTKEVRANLEGALAILDQDNLTSDDSLKVLSAMVSARSALHEALLLQLVQRRRAS